MNYWQPKLELMEREALEELQLRRMKSMVERVYKKVPYYHDNMKQIGITPSDVRSLKDLSRLMFTRKSISGRTTPLGSLQFHEMMFVRVHASSGNDR